jgi:hypothetical protein
VIDLRFDAIQLMACSRLPIMHDQAVEAQIEIARHKTQNLPEFGRRPRVGVQCKRYIVSRPVAGFVLDQFEFFQFTGNFPHHRGVFAPTGPEVELDFEPVDEQWLRLVGQGHGHVFDAQDRVETIDIAAEPGKDESRGQIAFEQVLDFGLEILDVHDRQANPAHDDSQQDNRNNKKTDSDSL